MHNILSLQDIPAEWQELYQAALEARNRAYAPYSRYQVGVAVRCRSGAIYTGCNIENASFGLTVCAERVAAWHAVSAGERDLVRLAVVTADGSAPCGACRQVLAEFAPELAIMLADVSGNTRMTNLRALLPDAFTLER